MSDAKLERLRQMMREEEEKKNNNGGNRQGSSGDNASYPFWDIPENSTALIRLVPDKDEDNPWPWIERQTIKLTFSGTVGGENGPTDRDVSVTVPCIDMWEDKTCPINNHIRPWWKDDDKKELARLYYKKRSFIASGFVVNSPMTEKTVPENPLRRFIFGKELVDKLKSGMADPEMEYLPTDYLNGTDFKIRKTKKGEHNNYSTSEWSRRSRSLTEAEMLAIEQYGLWNLADFRGARPDSDGVAAIFAMFKASLNGDPYDYEEFGKYYRPYSPNSNQNSAPARETRQETVRAPVQTRSEPEEADGEPDEAPAPKKTTAATKPASSDAGSASAAAVLAKLRERTAAR